MVEYHFAIRCDPDIALQPRRTEFETELKGLEGVFSGVRPCPPVSKQNRWVDQRGESLLHAIPSCQPRRLGSVFNLQGSEIIIILLLALVVLGPEKLPDAMRKAGKAYAELKKLSTGFQEEFKAAVEEPMREMRDTASLLRDSADFTKLQTGEREEKPKSAEMVAPADPDAVPTDDLPFQVETDEQSDEAEDAGPDRVGDPPEPSSTDAGTDLRPGDAELRESAQLAQGADVQVTPLPVPPKPLSSTSAPDSSPGSSTVVGSDESLTGTHQTGEAEGHPE